MKFSMRLLISSLLLSVALHAQEVSVAPNAQEACPATPLFSVCDITFNAGADEVTQLQAEMKSPRFKTALVPAFYNGGNKWIIRVSPVDAGTYEYRLTSNVARFNGKTGTFQANPSEHPSFIRPANVHHWIHPDTLKPHLWVGGINHQRESLNLASTPEAMRAVEERIRTANAKGIIVDLSLASTPEAILQRFPERADRERWIRLVISRFAAFDITWLITDRFEGTVGGRPLLAEIGQLIKSSDPYNHPRSTGANWTSASLLADGWMDYVNLGATDDALAAVEHQFFGRPFVSIAKAAGSSAEFRHQLWNTTMSGAYPSFTGGDPALIKIWKDVFDRTRFWELEPYFDVDGGRALALDDTEYLVYVEKPSGPIEVLTAKHGYDVYWIDPATGESTKAKDYKGERFVSEAPSKDHDWILHISRDGRKQGMLKSYKFESRQNIGQEIEQNSAKVPFEIAEPAIEELSLSKPPKFAVKLKRETRATRQMSYVWTGEVVSDGQGYRVIGLGSQGTMSLPKDLGVKFPGVFNLRLSAINANGKAYSLDKVYRLVP